MNITVILRIYLTKVKNIIHSIEHIFLYTLLNVENYNNRKYFKMSFTTRHHKVTSKIHTIL